MESESSSLLLLLATESDSSSARVRGVLRGTVSSESEDDALDELLDVEDMIILELVGSRR